MLIRNTTVGLVIIGDIPNAPGGSGSGLEIPGLVTVCVYNDDAKKSDQLGALLTSGVLVNDGSAEPSTGQPQNIPVAGGGSVVQVKATFTYAQMIAASADQATPEAASVNSAVVIPAGATILFALYRLTASFLGGRIGEGGDEVNIVAALVDGSSYVSLSGSLSATSGDIGILPATGGYTTAASSNTVGIQASTSAYPISDLTQGSVDVIVGYVPLLV